ncbi:MAG TPA: class I SAM-dependent methyltransferase [Candidatus Methanoperedens sp.]
MKISNNRPVPPKEYDTKYFLTDCGGYTNFIESHGLKIDERISKSLRLADIGQGMNVLDIGSGRGEIVLHCALKKAFAVGIDYSPDAIKLASDLRKRYKAGDKMSFLRGNATKLPLKNNTFDRIFLMDLVEHLHENELDALFQNLNDLLKEDGFLIVHTAPNKLYYDHGYKIIRTILYLLKGTNIDKDIRSSYEKNMHVNEQTPKSLKKLLTRNGFHTEIRLYDSSHSRNILEKNLLHHPLSTAISSLIDIPFISQIFCRDIYAVAWKRPNNLGHMARIFDGLEKVHETEYFPSSKSDVIEEILVNGIEMGKNDTGVLGNGWYPLENWPPAIRWTGKKASVYLKPGNKRDKLFIKAISPFPARGQILINQEKIHDFEIQEPEWKLLDVALQDNHKKDIMEVTIELDKTWIPDKVMKNGDTRELGVAIQEIWIE